MASGDAWRDASDRTNHVRASRARAKKLMEEAEERELLRVRHHQATLREEMYARMAARARP